MNHQNNLEPPVRSQARKTTLDTQVYRQNQQLSQPNPHQQEMPLTLRGQQSLDNRQSMMGPFVSSHQQPINQSHYQFQTTSQSYQVLNSPNDKNQSQQRTSQNQQTMNQQSTTGQVDYKQIVQMVEQQMEVKINQIVEQKMQSIRLEVQNDIKQFKQDIIKMVSENNEKNHQSSTSQRDQINNIDRNQREFVQRLSSQHQLLMQEFENQKLLNKQSNVNIETKITEFENFIRLQGGNQSNYQIQRRKSMNTKIQLDDVNGNTNATGEDKVSHLQSELDNQKAIIQEMQKSMKNVLKQSNNTTLNRQLSNPNQSQNKVEYKLDKNNFLIDSQGKFIVNENGKVVQLDNNQVRLLKQNSLLK